VRGAGKTGRIARQQVDPDERHHHPSRLPGAQSFAIEDRREQRAERYGELDGDRGRTGVDAAQPREHQPEVHSAENDGECQDGPPALAQRSEERAQQRRHQREANGHEQQRRELHHTHLADDEIEGPDEDDGERRRRVARRKPAVARLGAVPSGLHARYRSLRSRLIWS
jgi:hypothetical protein